MSRLINNLQRCSRCQIFKPLDEFYLQRTSKNGRTGCCMRCNTQEHRTRRQLKRGIPVIPSAQLLSAEEKGHAFLRGILTCACCHQERPLSEFFRKRSRSPSKIMERRCRSCRKEIARYKRFEHRDMMREYMRRYSCKRLGITREAFNAMLERQNGRCAVCHHPLGNEYRAIDHDHASGKVRGIVHRHCNSVLGFAHDDPLILFDAANYLLRHHPHMAWEIMRQVFVPATTQEKLPWPSASA